MVCLFPQKLETYHSLCFFSHYRPQRSCGQGYVFTRVCDSVHGGVSGRETPAGRPLAGSPPSGRPPWQGELPEGKPFSQQGEPCPPAGRTPSSRENPLLAGRPPWQGDPPWQGAPPPRHTANERPVRILLECILVGLLFS